MRRVWLRCRGGTAVVLYTVLGGGHTWPGATRLSSAMATTQTVDATDLALTFLSQHRL